MNCIFCKIVAGKMPAHKVYEDDNVIAILDISQATTGHTLVIPKKHSKNITEMDEDDAQKLFSVLPKISHAINEAFNPIGINILINTDKPLQSIFHTHAHIIPRYENDGVKMHFQDNTEKIKQDDFKTIKKKIEAELH